MLLEIRNLSVRYKSVRAVDCVSLDIAPGETLGLVGESGSGKSTIGRAIINLAPIAEGTIRLRQAEIDYANRASVRQLRHQIQMVFQDPYGSLNNKMSVRDIVGEALDIHRIGTRKERAARVAELLTMVGLPAGAAQRYPFEFSGGQRQRIGIARAMAVQPSLLILDEPVAALDISIQAQILRLIMDLQRDTNIGLLFVAHDLNVVRQVSHRTAVMYLGVIVEQGATDEVLSSPRHPYTQALVSAIPKLDPDAANDRQMLQGEMPSPANPPSGCRFRTRCRYARELCASKEPVMEPVGKGSGVTLACHFWKEVADLNASSPHAAQPAPSPTHSSGYHD